MSNLREKIEEELSSLKKQKVNEEYNYGYTMNYYQLSRAIEVLEKILKN